MLRALGLGHEDDVEASLDSELLVQQLPDRLGLNLSCAVQLWRPQDTLKIVLDIFRDIGLNVLPDASLYANAVSGCHRQ